MRAHICVCVGNAYTKRNITSVMQNYPVMSYYRRSITSYTLSNDENVSQNNIASGHSWSHRSFIKYLFIRWSYIIVIYLILNNVYHNNPPTSFSFSFTSLSSSLPLLCSSFPFYFLVYVLLFHSLNQLACTLFTYNDVATSFLGLLRLFSILNSLNSVLKFFNCLYVSHDFSSYLY